jgi:AcrR family transcriptional regulator
VPPRKKIQIAEREKQIIRIAGEILAEQGLNALTMDSVLARVDFSKGTLYNHFKCREDLLVAFNAQCFAEHLAYFERGALLRGRARERFMAAGTGHELKQRLDAKPARFCLTDDILEAASDRWRDAFLTTHRETMGVFVGIVRDGVASGDLPRGTLPELVASAAWALSVGMDQLHEGGLVFRGVPKEDFRNMRHKMFYALLDGFGWKPLSTELDYEAVRRRILAEIYAPEARQLGLLPKTSRATAAAAR